MTSLFRCASLCLFGAAILLNGRVSASSPDVRVMSFNIRYGTARDGENEWSRRKEFLVETVRAFNPDLLGTQETLKSQRDFLAEHLPEYDHLGVGRDDGAERGEMMALFFKRDRFEKLDGGHFWLSETPDKIGSKSWDSSLPRMVTWVKLKDKQQVQAQPILYFNTHFDHMGPTARLESARLLRRQIQTLGSDCSIIVSGDFNADAESPPYKALFAAENDQPAPVIDSFRTANPDKKPEEGTFSGFKAESVKGARIDWIAVSRDWQVRMATIDRTAREGRTPSDHFPIQAVLRRNVTEVSHVRAKRVDYDAASSVVGGRYSIESHRDIPYYDGPDADARKHKLDIYVPEGVHNFPVLFFIHGGAWTSGDRKLYAPLGKVFARNGVGAVVISYRLSPGVRHPAHIEDVARAFAWTHRHISEYGGNPDQIFVAGQSAGGHLAALLSTEESYLHAHELSLKSIRGAIPISGIYEFRPNVMQYVIGPGREAADSASPLKHVTGDEPPFLILYAARDLPGCSRMAGKLLDALQNNRVESDCLEIADRNHISIIFQPMLGDSDPTVQVMLKFIARHSELKLQPRPE